jgi:hypothetical protein
LESQIARCDHAILSKTFGDFAMPKDTLERAVCKLAIAGEQAGYSVEQMIDFLNSGLTVEGLLDLIALRLEKLPQCCAPSPPSGWIVLEGAN